MCHCRGKGKQNPISPSIALTLAPCCRNRHPPMPWPLTLETNFSSPLGPNGQTPHQLLPGWLRKQQVQPRRGSSGWEWEWETASGGRGRARMFGFQQLESEQPQGCGAAPGSGCGEGMRRAGDGDLQVRKASAARQEESPAQPQQRSAPLPRAKGPCNGVSIHCTQTCGRTRPSSP